MDLKGIINMTIKQNKAIRILYDEILEKGLVVEETETIQNIISLCESKGQFIFHGDSFWSFVKSHHKTKPCMRMIFALKDIDGGKVHNIERIMELIHNIESVLVFVDCIDIVTTKSFIYIDVIKYF